MGEMRRAIAREEQERVKAMEAEKLMTDRFASTLVIAASIIAAVRLAREQDIGSRKARVAASSLEDRPPARGQGGLSPAGIAVQTEDGLDALRCGVAGGRKPGHLLQFEAKPFCKNILRRFFDETSSRGFLRIANSPACIRENL